VEQQFCFPAIPSLNLETKHGILISQSLVHHDPNGV